MVVCKVEGYGEEVGWIVNEWLCVKLKDMEKKLIEL